MCRSFSGQMDLMSVDEDAPSVSLEEMQVRKMMNFRILVYLVIHDSG